MAVPPADPAPGPAARPPADARLPGLDGLRAVAAFCVVVMHVGAIYHGLPRLLGPAYLAVDFFFMLSGFVMARTYEGRMHSGRIGPGGFLRARYLRLWPTMLVGALLALPFVWRDSPDAAVFAKVVLLNLILMPTMGATEIFALNVPAWSIFFELIANALHAGLWQKLGRSALMAFALICLGGLVLCGWYFGNLDLGSRKANMVGGLMRVGFAYPLGILLWRLHGDRAPLRVPPLLAFLAMPVLFGAATFYGVEGWRFDSLFVALACPLLLWGGLRLRRFGAIAGAAGALSFPLYAVHFPVLLACEAAQVPPWAAVGVAILVAGLVASLVPQGYDHIRNRFRTV